MVANTLLVDTLIVGDGVKIQRFQKMVMLHIKLKRMTNTAHILSSHTPSNPGVGSKFKTIFFYK